MAVCTVMDKARCSQDRLPAGLGWSHQLPPKLAKQLQALYASDIEMNASILRIGSRSTYICSSCCRALKRQRRRYATTSQPSEIVDVAVLGGGPAGLSLAAALSKRGHDLDVL